jgi:hypothetical protein
VNQLSIARVNGLFSERISLDVDIQIHTYPIAEPNLEGGAES